jgi:putative endonuclease
LKADAQAAEDLAADFLRRRGLTILQRNYRCRFGEIDLVARDAATLVFVEVRLRRSSDYGGAGESVTASKQAKLIRAARHYLSASARVPECRFDVLLLRELDERSVDWIKAAFEA